MKKLVLLNWTDRTANDVLKKIEMLEHNVLIEESKFDKNIKKVQSDNNIQVSINFNPEVYRP